MTAEQRLRYLRADYLRLEAENERLRDALRTDHEPDAYPEPLGAEPFDFKLVALGEERDQARAEVERLRVCLNDVRDILMDSDSEHPAERLLDIIDLALERTAQSRTTGESGHE